MSTVNTTESAQPYISNEARIKVAKAFAKTVGDKGARGGWIYSSRGIAITQGWFNYERDCYREIRDWVTRQITAFDSFGALVSTHENYRPTLRTNGPRSWREQYLADSFDVWMAQQHSGRRAWRGSTGGAA